MRAIGAPPPWWGRGFFSPKMPFASTTAFPSANPHRAQAALSPYVTVSSTDKVQLGSSAEATLNIVKR